MAPIFAIIGFVFTSLLDPNSAILTQNIKKSLNWFALNPGFTQVIAYAAFILSILFTGIAVYQIISAGLDTNSDSDLR